MSNQEQISRKDAKGSVTISENTTMLYENILDSMDNGVIALDFEGKIILWKLGVFTIPRKLKGHLREVTVVTFSPDGHFLATGDWDSTINIRDAQTGEVIRTLTGHTEGVSSVTFSPDSQRIISADKNNTIKVWDVHTGRELHTIRGQTGRVNSVILRPDGKIAASLSSDSSIELWDTQTGKALRTLKRHADGGMTSTAFQP